MLTREQILRADDRKVEEVDVPEWGGAVGLRPVSGTERAQWEDHVAADGKKRRTRGVRELLLSFALCDAEGNQLFPGPQGVEELGGKSGAVLDRLFDRALELSRIAGGSAEEEEKNSAPDRNGSSTTG